MIDRDNYVTGVTAARILGVSQNKVIDLYRAGELQRIQFPGGKPLYVRSSVEALRDRVYGSAQD